MIYTGFIQYPKSSRTAVAQVLESSCPIGYHQNLTTITSIMSASEGATNETQLAHQDIDLLQASKAILQTCQWCKLDRGYCQLCHFQRQLQPETHWVVWKMFLLHLKLQLNIQFLQHIIIGNHERDSWFHEQFTKHQPWSPMDDDSDMIRLSIVHWHSSHSWEQLQSAGPQDPWLCTGQLTDPSKREMWQNKKIIGKKREKKKNYCSKQKWICVLEK